MSDRAAASTALTQKFAVALVLFVLIMAGCFGYLAPELTAYQQMIASANDAIISVNVQLNDINARKIRDDADRARFAELEKDGFIGSQNRLNAVRILEALRLQHRISELEYQIDPVETRTILRQPENTGEKLSVSVISLSLRGFVDRDLRDFTAAVKRDFPGFITITEVEMEKIETPSNALLSQIQAGQGSGLVNGSVKLLWQVIQKNQEDDGS